MTMTGLILRTHGGVYEVETAAGVVEASLRGRVKREGRVGDRVVVGDRVELEQGTGEGEAGWTIEQVHDRRSALVRKAPGKAPRAKVLVANLDQVLIVFATARPEPHLRMLDRFLVLCESNDLEPVIVANKVDLVGEEAAAERFGMYERIGYPVLFTSVKAQSGLQQLRERVHGRVSAVTGPSGVGKSSLLNALEPGLGLRVSSVSEAVHKGRHTTVTAQLIPLECGGYVADTPGLRELGLWGIDPEELELLFPEFAPYRATCHFGNTCTHTHEPGCAIRVAAEKGEIPFTRYDSYCRLFRGEEE
jgi:ribosome biogenesis GTPase / thiamine phosphate phosphatase